MKRSIAGMHVCKNGNIALVWLTQETTWDEITVTDSCQFKSEVPAVIAEGINARGRHIPIAWAHKEFSDKFLDRGCRMLPEACDGSNEAAEVTSREIWERLRSHRLKADKRLRDWFEEAETLEREDGKIPVDTYPLMAATRNAVQMIDFAKRIDSPKTRRPKRKLGIV